MNDSLVPSWLYIAGRGHSGSTMLDGMLGNATSIESVGELVSGMGRYESLCSCGETFKDCPFWVETRMRFEEEAGASWDEAVRASVGQAHLDWFFRTFFVVRNAEWTRKLQCFNESIVKAIGSKKNANNELVVDSSKEITRGLFLLRFSPETKIIHLVRHPINILQSDYYRLKKGSGFKFLRKRFTPSRWYGPFLFLNTASWLVGNLLADLSRQFGKDRFLRVKYEDLIASPIGELDRIEKFIGVPLEEVKRKVREKEPFDIGHNIGGNHMRMAGSFVFDPKKGSRSGLPKRYSFMVNVICGPLLWAYGYYSKK